MSLAFQVLKIASGAQVHLLVLSRIFMAMTFVVFALSFVALGARLATTTR